MATGFAGVRGTGDWGTDERPKNFREMILWTNPNGMAPITALSARMKKESVNDPEFAWWEETLKAVRVTINYATGYATSVTASIKVDADALLLVPGDVLQVEQTETGTYNPEIVVVSSVTDDTTISLKRSQANSTAVALADDAALTKIGNVFMEGSSSPDISQRNPTKKLNYTQIFKTSVGITETARATKSRTGDAWLNDKKRKSFDHSVAMEFAWLFGRPYEDTTGTKPKRFTGGLRYFITTNVTVFTTTPTEDTLLAALYPVFNYQGNGAGDERIVFCGNGFLNTMNKVARDSASTRINYDGVIDLYGMRLTKWVTPQGVFALKTHPLMNTHAKYTYSAFVLDPTGIIYRPLRDTEFQDNIQDNDADERKGQWLTEAGIEVHHEETMAYIGNCLK